MGLLLAGGAALLIATGTKKRKKKKQEDALPEPPGPGEDDESDPEPPSNTDGQPDRPPIQVDPFVPDEPEPVEEPPSGPTFDDVALFPPGYQPSVSVPSDSLYIDPNGEGYAIGKDFSPELSIKGKKYNPKSFFAKFTPDEDPINSWQVYPAPATADYFTTQLMTVWANASGAGDILSQMPSSGGMSGLTEVEYFNAWMAYAERYPAIAALFFDLQEKVGFDMMMKLYETNRDKYKWVFMHFHAENALVDMWGKPIADIVDHAYKETWPSAPDKITSKKSDWAKKWNTMLGYVNNLKIDMAAFRSKNNGQLPSWRYIEDVIQQQLA